MCIYIMHTCTYTHKIIKLKTYTHPTLTLSISLTICLALYHSIPLYDNSLNVCVFSPSLLVPLALSSLLTLLILSLTPYLPYFLNYPNKTPTLRITKKKLKLYIVSHFKFNIVKFLTTDINENIFAIQKNI